MSDIHAGKSVLTTDDGRAPQSGKALDLGCGCCIWVNVIESFNSTGIPWNYTAKKKANRGSQHFYWGPWRLMVFIWRREPLCNPSYCSKPQTLQASREPQRHPMSCELEQWPWEERNTVVQWVWGLRGNVLHGWPQVSVSSTTSKHSFPAVR